MQPAKLTRNASEGDFLPRCRFGLVWRRGQAEIGGRKRVKQEFVRVGGPFLPGVLRRKTAPIARRMRVSSKTTKLDIAHQWGFQVG
jgi:hypothetical protein